ncbi:mannitol dehydrogenase family protein [Novosphingobium rosa]|uniref:mannitol dehydrogenase family protein n=1 Tax=Novosphingobium rosa TaxID=76978 RepID=UPI00082C1230|nr:mannitol dehydrogenase family protein [Novosphingobium rosa]
MRRLSAATLGPAALPSYDRNAKAIGILHFGLGAFTRAHQAWYTDRAMETAGGDWMIAGVSLRSTSVGAQLNPQNGLYTLAEQASEGMSLRIIGSIAQVILAPEEPDRIAALLAAPTTHVVTFTITEKGYCRDSQGGLDRAIADDSSIYRYLGQGLALRREAGATGLTLLSCDNLADNGRQLERLLLAYLNARDPALAAWTQAHCTFPNSMVDRIVPATTQEGRQSVENELGLRDEGAVLTEPFSQWVIEDRFAGPRPAWEQVGVQIVADVTPFETAKLRMLNGAHSALAYCGLQAGHTFVHEAMGDPALRVLVEQLMRQEAAPTIEAAAGQDLDAYADALVQRFDNPTLNHRLMQIAMDGSQKIPQRWLATLEAAGQQGRPCPALLTALAAWLRHVQGEARLVEDPRAPELADAWRTHGREGIARAMFGENGLMGSVWQPSDAALESLTARL